MGRAPCCDKVGLKKGPWTVDEDEKLASYISKHGHGSWRALPKKAGLLRCGKSCRLRWTNYLRPDIKRGEFSALEEQNIIQLHALLGNRWSAIAAHLPKRTDNEIKNYWNTHLKKRLVKMGLDPATHKPKIESASSDSRLSESPSSSHGSTSFAHMAQWESARLEAEARLARESALRAKGLWPTPSTCQSKPPTCEVSSNQSLIEIMSLKQDLGRLMSPSSSLGSEGVAHSHKLDSCGVSKGLASIELISTLQNWEKSLQGQAGLMWPDSWRFSSRSGSAAEGQQESSSCSSAQEQMSHGSPTSTLCAFELPGTATRSSAHTQCFSSVMKLSWSDTLQQAMSQNESANGAVRPLRCVELDDLQAMSKESSGAGGESPSFLSSIQGSGQCDGLERETGESEKGASILLDDLEMASDQRSSPIKIVAEDDLDHYWDNLLADSPRQSEENESIFL